jgi:predicted DNA-binding ribbon-helix-helix protein
MTRLNLAVKRRSIVIGSRKTSVSLEDIFWASLREIASERATTMSELVGMLDAGRGAGNLSSSIRVFVLGHYRNTVAGNPQYEREPRLQEANSSTAQAASIPGRLAGSGL